jgi:acyl-CoA thioesterase I
MKILPFTIALLALLIGSCCKPPDTVMTSIFTPNRYDGLDNLYARMAAGDSVVIVCYGNSITFGGGTAYPAVWQDLLRQQYSNNNIVVVNEGHGGWTAEMAAGGMDSLVLPHQPDLVTLIFGINDLYQEKGIENYETNLNDMALRLKSASIPLIIMTPTPLNNRNNKKLIDFCISADGIAFDNDVAFFNMHSAMVERIYAETNDPSTLMPDEIHYTDNGYRLIGEELMRYWMAK